jgi:hypothetical protein
MVSAEADQVTEREQPLQHQPDRPDNQEPILRKTILAENFSDKFLSSNFG